MKSLLTPTEVFKAQVPRAPGLPLEPPTASPADPFAGLPIACPAQQKGRKPLKTGSLLQIRDIWEPRKEMLCYIAVRILNERGWVFLAV